MKRTVLISGASGNLGKALVKKFLQEGYRVAALVSPRSKPGKESSDNLLTYPVDLLDEDLLLKVVSEIQSTFERIGTAVFTAGGYAGGRFEETGMAELERMFRLNFLTAYNLVRLLFDAMIEQEEGHLVFIGARPAVQPGLAGSMIGYSLSKSLLFRLAEIINRQGSTHGVLASVVVPGTIDTPQNRSAMPEADHTEWVAPELIADRIFLLGTEQGRKERGTVLRV